MEQIMIWYIQLCRGLSSVPQNSYVEDLTPNLIFEDGAFGSFVWRRLWGRALMMGLMLCPSPLPHMMTHPERSWQSASLEESPCEKLTMPTPWSQTSRTTRKHLFPLFRLTCLWYFVRASQNNKVWSIAFTVKQWKTDTWSDEEPPEKHYTKWNKPDAKDIWFYFYDSC